MFKVFNFAGLQLCWLACVVGAGLYGQPWLALLVTAAFVVLHFNYTDYPRSDLRLVGYGLIVGLILDSLWSATGLITYQQQGLFPLAPVWIACLWVAFMLTLNHSLAWLRRFIPLAVMLSAVSSPLSYYAGHKIGALQINEPLLVAIAIAISWGILIPGFLILADKLSHSEQARKHAVV